jgi:regulator of ribonuclease activity A
MGAKNVGGAATCPLADRRGRNALPPAVVEGHLVVMPLSTADLCDAHPDVQIIPLPFRDLGARIAFHGPVRTVKVQDDNSLVRQALEEKGHGAVLVVDGGASNRVALLGDQLAVLAVRNGWEGVVVNGCVRDSALLGQMEVGVKALGTCPRKSAKGGAGERDVPVTLGGVRIEAGHFLYADADGIIVSSHKLG